MNQKFGDSLATGDRVSDRVRRQGQRQGQATGSDFYVSTILFNC